MWIAKLAGIKGEFEAETREALLAQLVEYFANEEEEFKARDFEYLGINRIKHINPRVDRLIASFMADLGDRLNQAREDYENNDPMEHRTHPL